MITLTPLSVPYAPADAASVSADASSSSSTLGAEVERPKALAYLLDLDEVRILVGVGAPEVLLFGAEAGKVEVDDATTTAPPPADAEKARRLQGEELASRAKTEGLDTLLADLAPSIDLVLLCHSTLSHAGLYAYAWARLGLKCPTFASLPVATMARLTTLEVCDGWHDELPESASSKDKKPIVDSSKHGQRCVANKEEIDEAFETVKTVRYMQPTQLEGKCAGLTLTAYAAGHSLGGTLWKLRSPTAGTILLALDWNHMRERHLDGTALIAAPSAGPAAASASTAGALDAVRRADVMLADVERGLVVSARRKDRDAALLDLVHTTIRSGHSVLMPVDASARLLELLVLLDAHWAYAYPHAKFPLCLVSRTGREVLERARTLMEWTTSSWAVKAGEEDSGNGNNKNQRGNDKNSQPSNPLDFKYLRIFSSITALDEAFPPEAAKVVLAVPLSLTHGPARTLLTRAAQTPGDVVILTQRGDADSLGRWLYEKWEDMQKPGAKWGKPGVGKDVVVEDTCEIELHQRVALVGDELAAHLAAEQAAKERAATQKALRARTRRRLEADEEGDSSDSDDSDASSVMGGGDAEMSLPDAGGEPGSNRKRKRDGTIGAREAGEGPEGEAVDVSFDVYLRGTASRATTFFGAGGPSAGLKHGAGVRYRMFPFVERKRRVDAYGETIDVGRWLSRRRQMEASGPDAEHVMKTMGETADAATKRRAAEKLKEEEAAKGPPSKVVSSTVHLQLACRVAYVDMCGLADGRALKTLIPQLLPRRLLLVGGTAAAHADAQQAFAAIRGMTKEIHAPALGQLARIGELTNVFTIHLGEALLENLKLSRFEDYEVAHLRAAVSHASGGVPTLEPVGSVNSITELDDDDEAPADTAAKDTPKEKEASSSLIARKDDLPPTLFIGDLHLSTLKASLARAHRMASEFAGEGSLVCGTAQPGNAAPGVTVQKQSAGNVVIEGHVGRNFYAVRQAVYALHAVVEGA